LPMHVGVTRNGGRSGLRASRRGHGGPAAIRL
jgi:hypothetical protein